MPWPNKLVCLALANKFILIYCLRLSQEWIMPSPNKLVCLITAKNVNLNQYFRVSPEDICLRLIS
jgi:hypothetical protein